MADRFWVGGSGTWDSLNVLNWSLTSGGVGGATVPGASDAVIFDAASGSGTITLGINPTVQKITCTGFIGTLAFGTNTISLNSTGTIFTGSTTMTVTGTPLIICTSSSGVSRTISPGAVTEANSISFRISAGTGAFTVTSSQAVRDLDFTDGTNPTGYAGAFAATAITVYGSFKASTGMTQTAGGNGIIFAATSGPKTITFAGLTFNRPFTFNGVGGIWQFQDALTMGSTRALTFTNGTIQLKNGTTNVVGSFATSGTNQKFLQSTLQGSQATLSQAGGTVNANNLTIRDINTTGGATWNAFFSNGNVNNGNNTGWDFFVQLGRTIYTRRKNKVIFQS